MSEPPFLYLHVSARGADDRPIRRMLARRRDRFAAAGVAVARGAGADGEALLRYARSGDAAALAAFEDEAQGAEGAHSMLVLAGALRDASPGAEMERLRDRLAARFRGPRVVLLLPDGAGGDVDAWAQGWRGAFGGGRVQVRRDAPGRLIGRDPAVDLLHVLNIGDSRRFAPPRPLLPRTLRRLLGRGG